MIYGRLRRLGFSSLNRDDFESFTRFREERDSADTELLAILAEIEEQTGQAPQFPPQGEVPAEAHALGSATHIIDLKRIAAYLESGALPDGPRTVSDPSDDPALAPYLLRNTQAQRFPHLLEHAESSGYFVPLPFARPFWLTETSRSVGSAVGLITELREILSRLNGRADFPGEIAALEKLLPLCEQAVALSLTVELLTNEP